MRELGGEGSFLKEASLSPEPPHSSRTFKKEIDGVYSDDIHPRRR
jgi:hypothetical protein